MKISTILCRCHVVKNIGFYYETHKKPYPFCEVRLSGSTLYSSIAATIAIDLRTYSYKRVAQLVLRIRDVYPGSDFFPSRIRIVSILDPGSASKNLSILTKKKWFLSSRKYDPGCSSRIRILTFYPSRIPDLGVKKARIPVAW